VALFIVLYVAVRKGALQRPGLVTGLFAVGYGAARIFCEFFREPDPQLGFLFAGATMGMILSVPLIIIGIFLLAYALKSRKQEAPA
jgi:phosphatidylglycerol:prolipoprotein diacylglycerol transferase